ncbi:hypothetical protein ACQJBY_011645 [Aegilops geniculata]
MWTSGPSRALYSHFGDVVTFDTTYETNIYKMPFGMFVGVNNHFQSIIFAGVLLTNETTEYFDWAFKEFVLMMGGKAPCTMLADQALAMAVAIKRTLPKTTHRWCKWHVLRRAQEVLGHVYKKHLSFGDDFNMVVNHMLTVDEFERAWDFLIEKYNLRSNPFMTRVYECRAKWAKPYFNDIFCARMTSTQRSESANHVLKIYIAAQSSLNVFVKQYTKLISQREKDDNEAEKNTSQRSIKLTMRYPIEHHASKIYTISVYKLFLQELLKSSSYIVAVLTDGALYEVRHVESATRETWSRVIFNIEISCNGQFYKCQCGLYSHFGILCCHALRVMLHLGVCEIPDLHIMKRWTRQARSTVPANLVEPNVEKGPILTKEFRHEMIHMATIEIPSPGDHDNETYDIVMRNIERLKKEVSVYMSSISTTCQIGYGSHQSSEDVNSSHNSVMDDCSDVDSSKSLCIVDENSNKSISISSIKAPLIKKKRGRNHNSRYKSRLEGIIRKPRPLPAIDETCKQPGGQSGVQQTRFCGYCRGTGHDVRTCETRLQDGVEITPKRRKKCTGIPERCI